MVLFQIFFLLLSLLGIFVILQKKRKDKLGVKGTLFWLLVLILADIVVIKPDLTTTIANRFGIGRGVDFVLYLALIVIFFLLFKLHLKLESLNRDVTEIVRQRALEDIDEE